MKLLVGIVLACVVGAYGQGGQMTEGLMRTQAELSLTHEFFENLMAINRGQLSAYMYRVGRLVIASHLDTYEFILARGNAARAEIEAIPTQNDAERACIDNGIRRHDLQKQRFGQALARCIERVHTIMTSWNTFTNTAHDQGQILAANIQNLGFQIFAETTIFDGDEDFPAIINRELWLSISRIFELMDQIEEFISGISIDLDEIVGDFIRCDRELEDRVVEQVEIEVGRVRSCVEAGGVQPPNPTL